MCAFSQRGPACLGMSTYVDPVQQWCQKHIGKVLPVTNIKNFEMTELWEDRAVRVQTNEGEPCCNG